MLVDKPDGTAEWLVRVAAEFVAGGGVGVDEFVLFVLRRRGHKAVDLEGLRKWLGVKGESQAV